MLIMPISLLPCMFAIPPSYYELQEIKRIWRWYFVQLYTVHVTFRKNGRLIPL